MLRRKVASVEALGDTLGISREIPRQPTQGTEESEGRCGHGVCILRKPAPEFTLAHLRFPRPSSYQNFTLLAAARPRYEIPQATNYTVQGSSALTLLQNELLQ